MMYYDTVETCEDEIIIEDDRVYSSKLGTGIARVIRIDKSEEVTVTSNFNVKIRYKGSTGYDEIKYNCKSERDMKNKLKDLEHLLDEIKNHQSAHILVFNYLIIPSEVVSVYASILIISDEGE